MMRVNAPISALLALAVLCFFPVDSLAKPTRHHVHKTTVAAPVHPEPANPPAHTSGRHSSIARVRTQHAATHHHISSSSTTRVSQPRLMASTSTPRTATSDDFIKAAEVTDPPAIDGTSHSEDSSGPSPRSTARRRDSVAKPVSVVNVIRSTTEGTQLPGVEEAASTPVILPTLYNKRGHLIVPPPLRGSHEILVHQNQVANHDGLDRIQGEEDLLNMRSERLLVSLPASNALQVDERLPLNRRYCRPWTAQFLATLARAHYTHFHTPLQVNSAVRTVEFQQHLVHINGNAAPAEGDTASPHLTGQAIDIAKHGLSLTEIAWLRGYLLPLVQEGKVDVEEEFQQACFHVSVYKKYLPSATDPGRNLETPRHTATTALATAIR